MFEAWLQLRCEAPERAEQLRRHEQMVLIRKFETKIDVLYRQGRVRGPAHLGMGQEAVAVGAAAALRPGDRSIGTYRGHAHALARGAPPDAVLRELLGRVGGSARARAARCTSPTSSTATSALRDHRRAPADRLRHGVGRPGQRERGHRLLLRRRHDQHRGVPRALNFAGSTLPVVFVCENNLYMEYTLISDVMYQAPAGPGGGLRAGPDRRGRQRRRRRARRTRPRRLPGARRRRPVAGRGGDLPARRALRRRPGGLPSAEEVSQWKERDPLICTRRRCSRQGAEAEIGDRRPGKVEIDRIATEALPRPPDPATAWTDMERRGARRGATARKVSRVPDTASVSARRVVVS